MTKVNRRENVRLKLSNVPCSLTAVEVAGRPLQLGPVPGELRNLSAGGCSLQADLDLPIRLPLRCRVEFALHGETFSLDAHPVRKLDDRRVFTYGLRFIGLSPNEEARLFRTVVAMEVAGYRQDREGEEG